MHQKYFFTVHVCEYYRTDFVYFFFYQNDNTSLHYASKYGHIDIVKFLLDHGAIIEAGNKV